MDELVTRDTLFFDLDGTLINSEVGITRCVAYALTVLGEPVPDAAALRRWIGPPLRTSFAPLLHDPTRVERAVELYRERFDDVGWREHVVYEHIAEVIHTLAASGHRLAVVTAKNEPHAQRIVEHLPFGHRFENIIGASMDSSRSEKTELIAEAMRRLQVVASGCVMIGDRHMDIDGANAHGMRSLGVLWGFGTRDELATAGAGELVERPDHLIAVLA